MATIGKISLIAKDASGNRLGDGPVAAKSASVRTVLDGVGSWRAALPLSDERGRSLLTSERRVDVYVDGTRLGGGIIREVSVERTDSGFDLIVSGPDDLNELQRASTLRGRLFDDVTVSSAAGTLVGLVSGWSASSSVTDKVHLRFDGQSVFKALRAVAKAQGVHVRAGSSAKSVELGAFGAASGLRVFSAEAPGAASNSDLMLLERISLVDDTHDVVNWIEPVGGGGGGDAEITLKAAYDAGTRTTGLGFDYDILTTPGPRGNTLYYLTDSASVTAFGEIQQVGAYTQIRPLSNASTDLLRASQALYDVAAADLKRRAQKLTTVDVVARPAIGADVSGLKPGNKIRIAYKGVVEKDGSPYTYLDVDDDYWIMRVEKAVGLNGVKYTLRLASVDRVAMDAAEVVVGALEQIQVDNVSVRQFFNHYNFTYEEEIAPSFNATIPLDVTAVTRGISRVLLRLTSRPFRATASGAASGGGATSSSGGGQTSSGGGDHNHRVLSLTSISGFPSTSNRPYIGRDGDGGAFLYVTLPTNTGSDLWTEGSSGNHTHTVSDHTHSVPNHTHSLTYGISDDTTYPAGVQVWINGVNRTAALGGPWGSTGSGIDEELDITEYINGAATLRQRHEIEIRCSSGQGIVQGNIDVQETITSVDVSI